jgi:hypothetical protein
MHDAKMQETDCSSSSTHESFLQTPSILKRNINISKIAEDDNILNKLVSYTKYYN